MPYESSGAGSGSAPQLAFERPTARNASGWPARRLVPANVISRPSRAGASGSTPSSGGEAWPAHALPNATAVGRRTSAVHMPRPSVASTSRRGPVPCAKVTSSQTTFAGPSLVVDQCAPASSLANTPTSVAA
jgi:hypothetical protein